MIHENIPAFNAQIEKKYLYDMDETYANMYIPCTVFSIASYKGDALTFQILLEDGSVFSYIPLNAILKKQNHLNKDNEDKREKDGIKKDRLELSDLVYKNCPGEDITVADFNHLHGRVDAYFKQKNLWLEGEYICTIDWPRENELFHLIGLENNQYAALPNHKIKFKTGIRSFQDYKKLHQEWRV